ncbi:GTPase-associated system all-helical protein GASH [Mesorhizobium sp. M0977]|uniref:GTPase-associated system all-helical protein GASH n=1 Tax=Mesorhizobium sp. M0977 TaxID=2957039 RepID=UPI0033381E24
MDNISVHMRITGLTPSNEDVDSRRAAASQLATSWGKVKDVDDILRKVAAIAEALGNDGTPTADLGEEIQAAVQKSASAFLYSERPLEVGVCAGMAALSIMKQSVGTHGWTIVDVYSNALWSALAFQPALAEEKRESLRREVLEQAQQRSLESANKARERDIVADPVDLVVTIGEESKVTTNFRKAAQDSIEALRRNAALDREELDFLWWVQLNRSRLLDRPFAGIAEATRLVASGVEASKHLRRMPAEVHRDLVLRTAEADSELDLAELIAEIGENRTALVGHLSTNPALSHPTIFPLLHALSSGTTEGAGATARRKASIWGGRALLESALLRMMSTGIIKK